MVNRHRPSLTVIHRLPEEVLFLIFEEARGCSTEDRFDYLNDRVIAP